MLHCRWLVFSCGGGSGSKDSNSSNSGNRDKDSGSRDSHSSSGGSDSGSGEVLVLAGCCLLLAAKMNNECIDTAAPVLHPLASSSLHQQGESAAVQLQATSVLEEEYESAEGWDTDDDIEVPSPIRKHQICDLELLADTFIDSSSSPIESRSDLVCVLIIESCSGLGGHQMARRRRMIRLGVNPMTTVRSVLMRTRAPDLGRQCGEILNHLCKQLPNHLSQF